MIVRVMLSEASVSHSVHGGGGEYASRRGSVSGGGSASSGVLLTRGGSTSRGIRCLPPEGGGLPPGGSGNPPVMTCSDGHCSGRYASYWNAFLFYYRFISLWMISLQKMVD